MSLSHWARRQKWLWKSDCSEAKRRKTTKVYSAIITGSTMEDTAHTFIIGNGGLQCQNSKERAWKVLTIEFRNRCCYSFRCSFLWSPIQSLPKKFYAAMPPFFLLEFQCGKWEFLQIEGDLATGKDKISTNGWDFIPKLIHLHFSSIRRNFDQSEIDMEISIAQLRTPSCKRGFTKQ